MTTAPDPLEVAARAARRTQRQPKDAFCITCLTSDVDILLNPGAPTAIPRTLLESHHIAGRHNDDALVVSLCLNCHRKATIAQHDAGALTRGPATTLIERIEVALRSLAAFLAQLMVTLIDWADALAAHFAHITALCPMWREQVVTS